jgi:hypothetical protein
MSTSHVKIVPLLDVHQLLMLSAGTLTYSKPGTFSSIVFIICYNYYYYYYLDVIVSTQIRKIELLLLLSSTRWLRHYATNRKVAGSNPDEVDFFQLT